MGLTQGVLIGMEWKFAVYCLTSLFAVLNPVGSLPIYLSLTGDRRASEAGRIAVITAVSVFVTLTAFMLLGEHLLRFFGIGLPAFRAGGGILILLMAVSMLQGRVSTVKHTEPEASESAQRDTVAIVPLAIPVLAGPGSISTVMLVMHEAETWRERLALFAAILFCALLIYGLFRAAQRLRDRIGILGINIVTRVMGLILAAIAVQFIAQGLVQLLPGLGAPR